MPAILSPWSRRGATRRRSCTPSSTCPDTVRGKRAAHAFTPSASAPVTVTMTVWPALPVVRVFSVDYSCRLASTIFAGSSLSTRTRWPTVRPYDASVTSPTPRWACIHRRNPATRAQARAAASPAERPSAHGDTGGIGGRPRGPRQPDCVMCPDTCTRHGAGQTPSACRRRSLSAAAAHARATRRSGRQPEDETGPPWGGAIRSSRWLLLSRVDNYVEPAFGRMRDYGAIPAVGGSRVCR